MTPYRTADMPKDLRRSSWRSIDAAIAVLTYGAFSAVLMLGVIVLHDEWAARSTRERLRAPYPITYITGDAGSICPPTQHAAVLCEDNMPAAAVRCHAVCTAGTSDDLTLGSFERAWQTR